MTYEQLDAAYKAAKERAEEFQAGAKKYASHPNHPTTVQLGVAYAVALVIVDAFRAARDVTPK